jgi:hypothetical protein
MSMNLTLEGNPGSVAAPKPKPNTARNIKG